ncbi:MAG: N-acetylglucosaminyl-diphospho-decaprenol L-rhamnosyltransferase [Acidimicrobiaceae bacterium]|nr:N-acetylglucosaminyl-diphospho-decaprenol L-rhamnosyltransferase [Acidimicrobiaceae bacterium]
MSTDVHISIVDHENRDLVANCLRSLPAACDGITWQATVIDNVSDDGSLEMLAADFPATTVIANTRRLGFGANHNQVLNALINDRSARYALILNDDTVLEPEAVTRLVRALDTDPTRAAVVPRIVDPEGREPASRLAYPSIRRALVSDWRDQYDFAEDHPDTGYLQGCCLLLRLSAIEAVGGFDERFFLFYEDSDLSRRLADAGWGLAVCPDAAVLHIGHASVFKPALVELTYLQGRRSRYLYLAKHEGRLRAELVTTAGRAVLLARGAKAWLGWKSRAASDEARRTRAQRLLGLARFNPRHPLAQEKAATGEPASPLATGR